MLLHFAIEIFANPKSHGESKIQNPTMPSIQYSTTTLFYEPDARKSTSAYPLIAASMAAKTALPFAPTL